MKKYYLSILIMLVCFIFCSCKYDQIELISEKNIDSTKSNQGVVTKEKIVTPTIDLESDLEPEVDISEENEETDEEGIETKASEESEETVSESEEANGVSSDIVDTIYEEDDRTFHGNLDIDTSKDVWVYGRTPCEWIYVEPNIQLISNYKPNGSAHYSVKSKVSSGLKGCYVPVFIKTDMLGNEYDGRVYIFEDYSKSTPDNMLFSNTLNAVKYKGQSVESILRKKMTLEKTANGLLKANGQFVNVVYLTDLDKILNEGE